MNYREARGSEIARLGGIVRLDGAWLVPSRSRIGKKYRVVVSDKEKKCQCADHMANGGKCQHIFAVEKTIHRVEYPPSNLVDPEPKVAERTRPTYAQDWRNYNRAQEEEKPLLMRLLSGFCQSIEDDEPQGRGRPGIPTRDMAFAICYKVYERISARRFTPDLQMAHQLGFISHTPHFNSVIGAMQDAQMTQVLLDLVDQTSAPLRDFERTFAADSSGFGNSRFDRWIDIKDPTKRKKQHTWTKVHLMCGTTTHIVTAVVIKDKDASDTVQLPDLVEMTAKNFHMIEVYADKAYGSISNYEAIAKSGAVPYIAFKSIHSGSGKDRQKRMTPAGELWKRMYHLFHMHAEEFYAHYHQRSNVESVFSMIKAKFDDVVRSKSETAMLNEVLCKIVCHNICVLIMAMFERGLDLDGLLAPKVRTPVLRVVEGGLSQSPAG